MNEGTKTGIFWGVAAVVAGLAALVAWPKAETQQDGIAGNTLFEKFVDPTVASSMKIVTFDEAQGTLDTFEVRKDRQSGLWTIPSREGYPADAIEQMKEAANSLVGIKILDIQTENAEDHDDLGVAEPKLEALQIGDTGVGRLVTFKNDSQDTLASLIIGDSVKDDPEKRYVRIPNQDPVYVVKFDETSLTTNFRDWIEDDLLQLSSIDIDRLNIEDYTSSLGQRGISLSRVYEATLALEATDWKLVKLLEFDPKDPRVEPTEATAPDGEELNTAKLNGLKNALDDLKIVNVYRKPEGVSATLKASDDLLADQDAVASLLQRGFFPVEMGAGGESEILSANGELSVSLKDGVKYILRFGNIAGVTDEDEDAEADEDEVSDAGVNRYLLVTTMVDEAKFPVPELKPIPQTVEELDAMLNPPVVEEPVVEEPAAEEPATEEMKPEGDAPEETAVEETATEEPKAEEMKTEEPAAEEPAAEEPKGEEPKAEEPKADEPKEEAPEEVKEEGTVETTGSGEASGSGQAQEADDSETEEPETEPETETEEPKLTAEEQQERLEAEQEKITKENQRKLDARKDRMEAAERRVRELNARFADWYYVIPEATYTQLRIARDELFVSEQTPQSSNPLDAGPQFQLPGMPSP